MNYLRSLAPTRQATSRIVSVVVGLGILLLATVAFADGPAGYGRPYRDLLGNDGSSGWFTPRNLIWVLAQLHLLFAAFVLAVPLFVLVIEIWSITSSDEAESKKLDGIAYEFTKLLTTAFSITSIVGAIFTFACIGLYPKVFNYLAEVFGPSMYLYATMFFGESFSLYFYYYGWGKFRSRWTHAGIGVMLNVFGITLMYIANAWTTFMMAPSGVDASGAVIDRSAAFFNYLLNPINVHRLIANMCLGGAVAAAYAAYRFLTARDDKTRARYDEMGYIGNFIAVLFLLPLPFAGYYLGFEIYGFNQQLGIYMMGGVLSWLFVLQAVLIGALFFAANYYLWLGMDRIPGAERYQGWIKFLLAIITVCILVWATPKSLILTSGEIDQIGGTNHPVFSPLGVMSAKNTAVNILILTTFLSFLIYWRGNKIPTVSWAKWGNLIQAVTFGAAAALVVIIGIGGYIPSMWLESTKRVAMSPYQVVAVIGCIFIVVPIEIMMQRGAKIVGAIRWGQVSRRSQYTLFFLAVSFTWLMALMGFVRSALRQHWHVYEVVKDTSPEAFTPAIGEATIVVTFVVILFFALVGFCVAISNLTSAPKLDLKTLEPLTPAQKLGRLVMAVAIVGGLTGLVMSLRSDNVVDESARAELDEKRATTQAGLSSYGTVDSDKGVYQIPIEAAMDQMVANPSSLEPPVVDKTNLDELSPMERGEHLFHNVHACGACHGLDGKEKTAPWLNGRFGKAAKLSDGSAPMFDAAYLKESIYAPEAKYADGYDPATNSAAGKMPSFEGKISDQEFNDLVAYLSTL